MYDCKYPHLFEPIRIAGRLFRNRIFASPTGDSPEFEIPELDYIAYYERKAQGGAASVCVGDVCVDRKMGAHASHVYCDDYNTGLTRMNKLTRGITSHGAVASLELIHAGSNSSGSFKKGNIIYGPMAGVNEERGFEWREMPEEIIAQNIDNFARSALNAKSWGFGMVTVHGGHGWLFSQFMSPEFNKRTDKWGGSFENNMRFTIETLKAIRKAVGPAFPIEIRISGDECCPGGYDINYGIKIAQALDGYADIIHVSTGSHENRESFCITHPSMFLEDGCNVKYAAMIKPYIKKSKIATVGALSDPEMMEEIIASGKADIVEMARGLICDPDLPVKARTGHEEDIRHCMRCFACFGSLIRRGHIVCAQNPEIGHERENRYLLPPANKKKVLIAGGGIGGMQAAVTCAERGHEVILCEKEDRLGGILRCEGKVPFKKHLDEYLNYQERLVKLKNVEVRTGVEVTPEYAKEVAPDVIICAVGATVSVPPIPGIQGENVVDVVSCYKEPEKTGQNVVILGGGYSGLELSVYLAKYYHRSCKVIEMLPELNNGGNFVQAIALAIETRDNGVEIHTGTKCVGITPEGVAAESASGQEFFKADTVVNALGLKARYDAAASLAECAPEFYTVGDCNTPRNIFMTTDEAAQVAKDVGRF